MQLANTTATGGALVAILLSFGPIAGAHLAGRRCAGPGRLGGAFELELVQRGMQRALADLRGSAV